MKQPVACNETLSMQLKLQRENLTLPPTTPNRTAQIKRPALLCNLNPSSYIAVPVPRSMPNHIRNTIGRCRRPTATIIAINDHKNPFVIHPSLDNGQFEHARIKRAMVNVQAKTLEGKATARVDNR